MSIRKASALPRAHAERWRNFWAGALGIVAIMATYPTELAAADSAAFNCPPRDALLEWTHENNRTPGVSYGFDGGLMRAKGGEGLLCYFDILNEGRTTVERVTQLAGFVTISSSNPRFIEPAPEQISGIKNLWPLSPGKVIQFTFQSLGNTRRNQFTVVGVEDIVVPAGKFLAWKIELNQVIPGADAELLRTYWWAPEVGAYIKIEYKPISGAWGPLPETPLLLTRFNRQ